jgi:hypothetical protein
MAVLLAAGHNVEAACGQVSSQACYAVDESLDLRGMTDTTANGQGTLF